MCNKLGNAVMHEGRKEGRLAWLATNSFLLIGFGIRVKGCLKCSEFWSLCLPGTAQKERPEGDFLVKKLCRLEKTLPLEKYCAAYKKVCRFILTKKWDTYLNRFGGNSTIHTQSVVPTIKTAVAATKESTADAQFGKRSFY